jgi:phage tail-like protein
VTDIDPVVGLTFQVTVDYHNLGIFSTCEGLGCELVIETREEGGNNGAVHQFPTRLKYPNVKLTRPLGPDSKTITSWFASVATGFQHWTAHIKALTPDGETVAEWSMENVLPVRWTGPSLGPDSPKVYSETLEIAHEGFLGFGDKR